MMGGSFAARSRSLGRGSGILRVAGWGLLAGLLLADDASSRRAGPPGPHASWFHKGWALVWRDEFSRPGPPDSSNWVYELGFERNEEPQLYTDRPANVRVEDGRLILEARRERVPNPGFAAGSSSWKRNRAFAEYTSGSLRSRRQDWQEGYYEIRARLPRGQASWPAFWFLGNGSSWPACGEIDVLEAFGVDGGVNRPTIHFEREGRHRAVTTALKVDDPYDWHVYSLQWERDGLEFRLDGRLAQRVDLAVAGAGADNPFRRPMVMILDLALRPQRVGEPVPDQLPARFEVDWVRVWRRR